MKRLHLFEVEDLAICPNWIRDRVTSMIIVVHRWLGVPRIIADQLKPILADLDSQSVVVVDVCSGSGGPMPDTLALITAEQNSDRFIRLVLTDIQPPSRLVDELNRSNSSTRYLDRSLDACLPLMDQIQTLNHGVFDLESSAESLVVRTLVCGFHHLPPERARLVLLDAQQSRQPLVVFELTDGTVPPRWLWWVTLLPNFLFGLVVSLFARPVTARGFVFSFLLPVIPACFAWDGAVTSARTYREEEFYELLQTLPQSADYQWEFKTVPGYIVQHSLIVGRPRCTQ